MNFKLIERNVSAGFQKRNHLYRSFLLPIITRRDKLDLLHIPNTSAVILRSCPTIVSIYDLVEYAVSNRMYGHAQNQFRRIANRLAARTADAIITTIGLYTHLLLWMKRI